MAKPPPSFPAAGFTIPPPHSVPPATAFATLAGASPWPYSHIPAGFIAHDARKAAGDIAGLHETTFYNLHVRLAARDGMNIGVDEATAGAAGANIHDGSYRRKSDDVAIISCTRNARGFF
jgi:hypothetical protein